MSRATPPWRSPASLLSGLVVALVIVCLLPPRALGWGAWFSSPLEIILAPARHPLRMMVAWLAPMERTRTDSDPALAAMTAQRDDLQRQTLQQQQELEDLRRQISELSRGLDLNPTLAVVPFIAPVIGGAADRSSGTLTVRAGARDGIERNTVAVIRGVHLVGRVTRVDDRICYVLPITDPGATPLKGVVMLQDQVRGPTCLLLPTRSGVLRGRVEDPGAGGTPADLKPGMTVRLLDPDVWPASAQMLVIGRITSIEPLPEQPLRKIVTVEPEFRIDRASQVTLRLLGQTPRAKTREGGMP